MRFAAHLGVKDEAALLPACLAHLRDIGVDEVLVTNMGSTDGSWEWLQAAAGEWRLSLERMDDREPGLLSEWTARVGARARACGADWVLFLDADEFPLPRDGSLHALADLDHADLLVLDRFNVPPGPEGAPRMSLPPTPHDYAGIPLLVRRYTDLQTSLAADPGLAWVMGVPGPKLMARPRCIGRLAVGAHEVEAPAGLELRRVRPGDLVVAHLPFTTRERFEAKVANAAAAVAANEDLFAGRIGWHWRRWIALREAGGLDAEYGRQCLDDARLQALAADDAVLSVAGWFARAAAGARP